MIRNKVSLRNSIFYSYSCPYQYATKIRAKNEAIKQKFETKTNPLNGVEDLTTYETLAYPWS